MASPKYYVVYAAVQGAWQTVGSGWQGQASTAPGLMSEGLAVHPYNAGDPIYVQTWDPDAQQWSSAMYTPRPGTPQVWPLIVGPGAVAPPPAQANIGDMIVVSGLQPFDAQTNYGGFAVYAAPGLLKMVTGSVFILASPGQVHIAWPGGDAYINSVGTGPAPAAAVQVNPGSPAAMTAHVGDTVNIAAMSPWDPNLNPGGFAIYYADTTAIQMNGTSSFTILKPTTVHIAWATGPGTQGGTYITAS